MVIGTAYEILECKEMVEKVVAETIDDLIGWTLFYSKKLEDHRLAGLFMVEGEYQF